MRDEDFSEVLRNVTALEAAEQRAFLRGRESAKLIGEVESHEHRLSAINGSLDRSATELRNLADKIQKLGEDFRQSVAVATSRATSAKEAAEAGLSTRTFLIGLAMAAVSVSGVVVAALALILA